MFAGRQDLVQTLVLGAFLLMPGCLRAAPQAPPRTPAAFRVSDGLFAPPRTSAAFSLDSGEAAGRVGLVERLEQQDAIPRFVHLLSGRVTDEDVLSIKAFLELPFSRRIYSVKEEEGVFTVDIGLATPVDCSVGVAGGGGARRIKLRREGQTWRILEEKSNWL